jgi:hypothetical protein
MTMRILVFLVCFSLCGFTSQARSGSEPFYSYNVTSHGKGGLYIGGVKYPYDGSIIVFTKNSSFDDAKDSIYSYCVLHHDEHFLDTIKRKRPRPYFFKLWGNVTKSDYRYFDKTPIAYIDSNFDASFSDVPYDTDSPLLFCYDLAALCPNYLTTLFSYVQIGYVRYNDVNNLYHVFEGGYIRKYNVYTSSIKVISFVHTKCDQVIFNSDTFVNSQIHGAFAENISFSRCKFGDQGVMFVDCYQPMKIELIDCAFVASGNPIDLTSMSTARSFAPLDPRLGFVKKPCELLIKNTDVDKINFNYVDFKLSWDGIGREERGAMYIKILERFKKGGQLESYKNLDIEYKQFLYLRDSTLLGAMKNEIDKWWWDYGYDKTRVIENSFKIFGLVILLNLLLFRWLMEVYKPKNFEKLEARLNHKYKFRKNGLVLHKLHKIPAILAYSSYVFWGIKLDVSELKFEKWRWPWIFLILMIEYLAGIVCLAYIANLIITK